MKDLLNHEFFAEETGLKVEVVSRDEAVASGSDKVDFRLRVLDPKKRRDKHKENEAIQFEFNVVTDDADKLAQDMVIYLSKFYLNFLNEYTPLFMQNESGILMEEDVKVMAKLCRTQVQQLIMKREERINHPILVQQQLPPPVHQPQVVAPPQQQPPAQSLPAPIQQPAPLQMVRLSFIFYFFFLMHKCFTRF